MITVTTTLRKISKDTGLSMKALYKAAEQLNVEVFAMEMVAYGFRGHVLQIRDDDVQKVVEAALNIKEEPKAKRVRSNKVEDMKAAGIEIVSETKSTYIVKKGDVKKSVCKRWSVSVMLKYLEKKRVRSNKVEDMKAAGIEIISETKTTYRVKKGDVKKSVCKHWPVSVMLKWLEK